MDLTLIGGAVAQIQVDEGLLGDAYLLRLCFEIIDGVAVEVDGDLLFQNFGVGVFLSFGKIVFCTHGDGLTFHRIGSRSWSLSGPR